jgi:general secretion pathway protein A
MDTNNEAAFIFNSKLDSFQLLKAIHKELGIVSSAGSSVELTHDLNEFLLEKKSQGKSVILLIDEAQNLAEDTLEQLRLLSNLETTKNKLLQIILVGQPELRETLDSHDLRQLRQRINLSCHIHPMTFKETCDYITHRINVASGKPQTLFTPAARKDIFKYSRGIPRLINIACDRSLLAAYSLNRKNVTRSSVKVAVHELQSPKEKYARTDWSWKSNAMIVFFILLLLGVGFLTFTHIPVNFWGNINKGTAASPSLPELSPAKAPSVRSEDPTPPAALLLPAAASLSWIHDPAPGKGPVLKKTEPGKILSDMKDTAAREKVLPHIISLWNTDSKFHLPPLTLQIDSDVQFFTIAAAQNNFQMMYLEKRLDLIARFNLPVILGYDVPDEPVKRFLGIVGLTPDNEYVIFSNTDNKKYAVDPEKLLPFLTGDMYIPWKDNFSYDQIVSERSSKNSIVSLKLLLNEIGLDGVDLAPVYDNSLKAVVKRIQNKYGLQEDGLVGPLTKIMLYNEKKQDFVPYLSLARFMDNP